MSQHTIQTEIHRDLLDLARHIAATDGDWLKTADVYELTGIILEWRDQARKILNTEAAK